VTKEPSQCAHGHTCRMGRIESACTLCDMVKLSDQGPKSLCGVVTTRCIPLQVLGHFYSTCTQGVVGRTQTWNINKGCINTRQHVHYSTSGHSRGHSGLLDISDTWKCTIVASLYKLACWSTLLEKLEDFFSPRLFTLKLKGLRDVKQPSSSLLCYLLTFLMYVSWRNETKFTQNVYRSFYLCDCHFVIKGEQSALGLCGARYIFV
jgi:hypothetical protein